MEIGSNTKGDYIESKQRYLLVALTIVATLAVALSTMSSAKTSELIFIRSDVGISKACSYYEIVNYDDKELSADKVKTLKISEKSIDGYKDGIKEVLGSIKNPRWEYYINEDYDCSSIDIVPSISCKDVEGNNTITEVCTTTYIEAPVSRSCNRNVWVDISTKNIDDKVIAVGEKGKVRFCADVKPSYTTNGWEISIDHIPEFDSTSYEEYAWWNAAWLYRYPIVINANGTSPAMSDGHFIRIRVDVDSMIAAGELQADLGDLRITDETDTELDIWVDRNDYYTNATIGFNATSLGNTYYLYTGNAAVADFTRYNLTHWIRWADDFDYVAADEQPSSLIWSNLHADDKVNSVGYTSGTNSNTSFRMANIGNPSKMLFGNGFARGMFEGSLSTQTGSGGADGYIILAIRGAVSDSEEVNIFWGNVVCANVDMVCYEDSGGIQQWTELYPNSYIKLKVTWDTGTNTNNFTLYNDTWSSTKINVPWKAADNNLTIIKRFGGYLTSLTYWDNVIVMDMENYGYEPIALIGAKESGAVPISLTVTEPTNMTYNSTTIRILGTSTDNGNVSYSFNGGSNTTIDNITAAFSITSNIGVNANAGNVLQVFIVKDDDATITDSETIYLSVDTIDPTVIISNPAYASVHRENTSIPLDFSATDYGNAASGVSACRYMINEGANQSIAGCNNGTISTLVTSAGQFSLALYGIDAVNNQGNDSVLFTYDPYLNFSVNDSVTGVDLQTFLLYAIDTGYYWSTTNGTMSIPLSEIGIGTRQLRFSVNEYNTTTYNVEVTNTSKFNNTYSLVQSSVSIRVFDETQAALGIFTNITFNLTIYNTSQSNNYINQGLFWANTSSIPIGFVTADISSNGYTTRRVYMTVNNSIAQHFDLYLLPTADSFLVRFHTATVSETPIDAVLVEARRFINSSWTIVSQQVTDVSGVGAMYLSPFNTYQITASKTGYNNVTLSLVPSSSDYVIYMTTGSGSYDPYVSSVTNISMLFTPEFTTVNASYIDFACLAYASDSQLEYVGMTIQYFNGTYFYSNSTANNVSVRLNYTADLRGLNGTNLTAICGFKRQGDNWYNVSRTYFIRNEITGLTGLGIFTALATYSKLGLSIISLLITAMGIGFIGKISGNMGAASVAGLLILGLLTFWLGWFDWLVYTLVTLTFIALSLLKAGGRF